MSTFLAKIGKTKSFSIATAISSLVREVKKMFTPVSSWRFKTVDIIPLRHPLTVAHSSNASITMYALVYNFRINFKFLKRSLYEGRLA